MGIDHNRNILIALTIAFNILVQYGDSKAQKRVIDSNAVINWPKIDQKKISNDGQYLAYSLRSGRLVSWHVLSTTNNWEIQLKNLLEISFTENSKWLFFLDAQNILKGLNTASKEITDFGKVSSFKISPGTKSILVFKSDNSAQLTIIDLEKQTTKNLPDVSHFEFMDNSSILIYQRAATQIITSYNFSTCESESIGEGILASLTLDQSLSKALFFRRDTIGGLQLCMYEFKKNQTKVLVSEKNAKLGRCILSDRSPFFGSDGKRVFFYVRGTLNMQPLASSESSDLNILKYNDREVNSRKASIKDCLFSTQILSNTSEIIRVQDQTDDFILIDPYRQIWACIYGRDKKNENDNNGIWLVCAINGEKRLVSKSNASPGTIAFSPDAQYLVWYGSEEHAWFSYNIENHQKVNISKLTGVSMEYKANDPLNRARPRDIMGWDFSMKYIYLYDTFDIWRVHLSGTKVPENVSSSFGVKNNTELTWSIRSTKEQSLSHPIQEAPFIIKENDSLLLSTFNRSTKKRSLSWLLRSKNHSELKHIKISGNYFFSFTASSRYALNGLEYMQGPLKAKNADKYIVLGSKTNGYPNLNYTEDFLSFKNLTNLEPQLDYNWYQEELVTFKLANDKEEGILYKPEDFDSKKKYPVIIHYYEQLSDVFNIFLYPDFSNGSLPIPWLVSRGYVVMVPDITYKKGQIAESAYQSVNATRNFLSTFSWVDIAHIGLQGHSFGGYETNYILTKTSKFAAACSAAGISNITSMYPSYIDYYESGQGRFGKSLWEKPDLYIRESAIFNTDKIETPILFLHNEGDTNVPYNQSKDLFMSLKKLNKPAWLLDYKSEGHSIYKTLNRYDFTIKLTNFFDHYLKGKPMPDWMY